MKKDCMFTKLQLKLPIFLSVISTFIYYVFACKWSQMGNVSNIKIYFISIIVFLVSFVVFSLVDTYLFERNGKRIKSGKWVACATIVSGTFFLCNCYVNELDKYAFAQNYFRHRVGWMYLLFLVLCISLSYHLASLSSLRNRRFRILFAGTIALLQSWFLYTPNPFLDDMGSITHIDAYTNSIINALAFTPYEMYSSSIYGHHGLFFIIPVKLMQLLGLSMWEGVTLTISFIGFLTFSVVYWGISQMVENDVVYSIGLMAVSSISFQIYRNQYFQMMPHRLAFQAFIIGASIIAFRNPDSKKIRSFSWIIAAMSMLWNIETGMVVTITWMVADFYLERKKRGFSVHTCLRIMAASIAAFFSGFAIVNIYNLVVGGDLISVLIYIYPIGSRTYQIDMLELALMNPLNGYFMTIMILMCTICLYSIKYMFLDLAEKEYVAFLSGCLGVGVFTYYMNRAVTTNATIVTFEIVLLLSFYADRNIVFLRDRIKNAILLNLKGESIISFCGFVILVGLSMASLSTLGSTLEGKLKTTWDVTAADEFISEADSKIPADSVGFGPGTAQLFAMMDRHTGIYMADWEDIGQSWADTFMNEEAFEHLERQLEENNYKHIVVHSSAAAYLPEKGYKKIAKLECNSVAFLVYERKENSFE